MPLLPALMSVVTPLTTSRRKIWLVPDGLFVTKLLAVLSNSANRPLVEMALGQESPLPPSVPARSMLTRVVVPLVRSAKRHLCVVWTELESESRCCYGQIIGKAGEEDIPSICAYNGCQRISTATSGRGKNPTCDANRLDSRMGRQAKQ